MLSLIRSLTVGNGNVRSFASYCDLSRQYDPNPSPKTLPNGTNVTAWTGPGVDTFVKAFGRQDLLDYSESFR